MLVKSIQIPYKWEDINIDDDNVDVFVELEDGYVCTLTLATAKNIESFMDPENINHVEPTYPNNLNQSPKW